LASTFDPKAEIQGADQMQPYKSDKEPGKSGIRFSRATAQAVTEVAIDYRVLRYIYLLILAMLTGTLY
jgi:hypothetical protein